MQLLSPLVHSLFHSPGRLFHTFFKLRTSPPYPISLLINFASHFTKKREAIGISSESQHTTYLPSCIYSTLCLVPRVSHCFSKESQPLHLHSRFHPFWSTRDGCASNSLFILYHQFFPLYWFISC